MAELPTLNTDLEQAVYKAALREKKLRQQMTLSIALPVLAGAAWLFYSASEVNRLRTNAREIEKREATVGMRESEARQQVRDIESQLDKSQLRAEHADQQHKSAATRAEELQQRILKVRDEIGSLGVLLTELSSARAKASRLGASEAVEAQITDIRSALSRSLGRIEQQIDIALPPGEQKARVFIFIADDQQRAAATQLKAQLETDGFDVPGITRNSGKRAGATEIRYFREAEDKAVATRIREIVNKQLGEETSEISYSADPDHTSGSRKFQIWLSKSQQGTVP
jgi:hypothetical protein